MASLDLGRDRRAVEKRLVAALEQARRRRERARDEFFRVIGSATDGVSGVDVLRIKKAAAENRAASEAYRVALRRFTDFVTGRTSPDVDRL
jgi:hypothetical protein